MNTNTRKMKSKDSVFKALNSLSYNNKTSLSLRHQFKDSIDIVQRLKLQDRLTVHNGCVNSICWNDGGRLILSGSDDQHLVISDPFTKKVEIDIPSGHKANIFSAKFLPNSGDRKIISCSGDGLIHYTNLDQLPSEEFKSFNCHSGTAYEVVTVPQDRHSFLSCGDDGTVRWFDLRIKDSCRQEDCKEDVLINCKRSVSSLAVNPLTPYQLAVGCSDSTVRLYDRRMLGTRATEGKFHRITSLNYSRDARELLVSYSSDHVYLYDMKDESRKPKKLLKEPSPLPEKVVIEGTASAPLKPEPSTSEGVVRPKTQSTKPPPVKRLRLRGDWSDTGPNARPEKERPRGDDSGMGVVQRMSEMITRWLDVDRRRVEQEEEEEEEAEEAEPEGAVGGVVQEESSQLASQMEERCDIGSTEAPADSEQHQQEISSREPVIDLEYNSQGTSSSSISMDYVHKSSSSSETSQQPTTSSQGVERAGPRYSVNYNRRGRMMISEMFCLYFHLLDSALSMPRNNPDRRRRIGLSGPPTGDFQLHGDTSSSSDSEDEEERNAAASKLQQLFRKRQEQRLQEEEEMLNLPQPTLRAVYKGHRNIKEAAFWGESYIMSGSDCGHVFVWDRHSGKLVMLLEADKHVVNCIQPHPYDPILATSGIDYDVKIWTPCSEESVFDNLRAEEIESRNRIMLEETRDTITVPASFMLRMLASINQFRANRRRESNSTDLNAEDEPES
ncbi:hypothetical protein CAPTEDRAFT_219756 [Capitella teleta]|uniref:DDB1- and CUL4-associated factor 6 n=1 Tax=Capitella teleta TaxID=283909 RepID=R7UNE8_CAPTE|nr:hypothetical protein CAPTEDRAFT_219756 [Capitella teleta]|eukprot:ELU04921.1 hypothetical protein CAPTEDRAFT_219756 [Capitella teleta]